MSSPYRHRFSKGVYITFQRPENLEKILIVDTGKNGDTLTISPWGPVAMCGPTETNVSSISDGFKPNSDDVRSLLDLANLNLKSILQPADIVSLRCAN